MFSRRIPFPSQSPRSKDPRGLSLIGSAGLSCDTVFVTVMQHCHPSVPTRWAFGLAFHRQWRERAGRTNSQCRLWPPCSRRWPSSCWFRLDRWGANKNLRNPSELVTVQLSSCGSAYRQTHRLKNAAMVPSVRMNDDHWRWIGELPASSLQTRGWTC